MNVIEIYYTSLDQKKLLWFKVDVVHATVPTRELL